MTNKIPRYQIPDSKYLFIILLLIFSLLSPILTHAQESTDSGIMQKLNQLKSEIASKAAQIKTEINKKVQNKAYLGTILDISSTEISLQTLNGIKPIKFDEFTEIIGSRGKKIKIDTLEVSDKIAALGDVDDKNNLVAQKLVYLDNLASGSGELVWGQIQKQSGSSISLLTKSGATENISTNSQTEIFLGNEEASITDAKVEKHLVTRATRLKDGSLRASFIYFIPSMGFTKPQEKASSLPKISSPSASAIPSPKN